MAFKMSLSELHLVDINATIVEHIKSELVTAAKKLGMKIEGVAGTGISHQPTQGSSVLLMLKPKEEEPQL